MHSPTWDTPERQALRQTARRFTDREIAPHIAAWEEAGALPRELHRRTAAAGLLGIGFPEEAGGSGGSPIDTLIVAEELIGGGGPSGLVASLFTHGIGLPHLVQAGDPALIDRVARPVLAGEAIISLAVTEPEAGSDVAGLRTRAVRDGDDFVVTGTKLFITSATRADFITTAVRTGGDGADGISLLLIDRHAAGVQVSDPLKKMGWWCSDTAEIRFDDVRVPAANLIGPEHSGFLQIMQQFAAERLSIADRWQAGDDVLREVAMAKNTAVAACDRVVDDAVQLHGGMGCMRETEVERHYRDSRILGIGGGTTEIMTEVVSRLLLA